MRILGCCGCDAHYRDCSSWTFCCGVGFSFGVGAFGLRVCLLTCWALDSEASVSSTLALCSDWNVGFFLSLFLCLHCVLGGLGVLDQGADSALRDSDVQVLLLVFSFSFWDWVF